MNRKHLITIILFGILFNINNINSQANEDMEQLWMECKEYRKEKKNNNKKNNKASPATNRKSEIILTVSADAMTKDEAIKTALRNAIEQAYGTFVSANTSILNDELIKDEIVTIASGNIKEYKELSCKMMPNGGFFVLLQAKVSVSNLTSYAQNKGAETEFAGATFGMNMKLKELNQKNEEIALLNMAIQVKNMLHETFSYKLIADEPIMPKDNSSYWNAFKHEGRKPEDYYMVDRKSVV